MTNSTLGYGVDSTEGHFSVEKTVFKFPPKCLGIAEDCCLHFTLFISST